MRKNVTFGRFDFLVDRALELGAIDVKVISTDSICVEDRVRLKCRVGCVGYGKKLTCPPHVPAVDEFRKILAEYDQALLVKFRSPAEADDATALNTYRNWLDPEAPAEAKANATKFWADYFGDSKRILLAMLELEKAAFNEGYTFAIAFTNGSCRLCEKCNVENGICLHPNMARIPEHAVGINMKKTAKDAGMPLQFPIGQYPEPMALLLID
jgi:predicted metal-binding protein